MSIFNVELIKQTIENFQRTHPAAFAYDISHFDSKENVDSITHFINDLCEKAQKDTEMHIIMEMAKQYMNGARPSYGEPKKGVWLYNYRNKRYRTCSACGYTFSCQKIQHNARYCQMCGARMETDNGS